MTELHDPDYVPSHHLAHDEGGEDEKRWANQLGKWTAVASSDLAPILKQFEAMQFAVGPGPELRILAYLGGWGSAKSSGSAMTYLAACATAPWRPEYKGTNPMSAIVAPTYRILRNATLREFEKVCPREFVRRRRGPPYNDIELVNGHVIVLFSGEGELEGLNLVNIWVDEVHHPAFDMKKWLNFQARCRDPLAPRRLAMCSGLPESGWVRDAFDKPPSPSRKTILAATKDNPFLSRANIDEFLATCAAGEEAKLLGGTWMSPTGAVFPQYDPTIHLVDLELRVGQPVHLSFDVGNQAACIVGQEILVPVKDASGNVTQEKGIVVVRQFLPDGKSVEELCYQIRAQEELQVVPGQSVITTDPTTDQDEMRAMQKHFPRVRIQRRERGDPYFLVEDGVNCMKRALRDALGNTRLFFARSLVGEHRGIIDAIQKLRYNPHTNQVVKDNTTDHVSDACRYLVCEHLPATVRAAPRFTR